MTFLINKHKRREKLKMSIALVSCLIGVVSCIIALGTLVFKFSGVVSMVNRHEEQIKEIKDVQKEQQRIIEKSLDDIRATLAEMNTGIKLLAQRMDYIEKLKPEEER